VHQFQNTSGERSAFVPSHELAKAKWSLPLADRVGYFRANFCGIKGDRGGLGLVAVPVGQRSPLHHYDAELLFLGLKGCITWKVDDAEYRVGPQDLLYVGPGTNYEYWNSGFEDALVAEAFGRTGDQWPSGAVYPNLTGEGFDADHVWHAKSLNEIEGL
jgi:mannose-6-phosphate isomerase-like protein (cupin superfamily)